MLGGLVAQAKPHQDTIANRKKKYKQNYSKKIGVYDL